MKQLVALRFASDAEVRRRSPARSIEGKDRGGQKAIKKMITAWRADYQRA